MADILTLWTGGGSRDPTWDLTTGFGGSQPCLSLHNTNICWCSHLSELSERGGGGGYHYRPADSFSGSYGSPDQPGYDGRDFRYASLARMSSSNGAEPALRWALSRLRVDSTIKDSNFALQTIQLTNLVLQAEYL